MIKPDQNLRVTNNYDQNGRVSQQLFPNGSTFQFAYTTDSNGNVVQTNVTDPSGSVRQVTFNSDGHLTSDTVGYGSQQQETATYELQPTSGLMISSTDALSRKTVFTYDSLGETTSVTRLAGTAGAVTTQYSYPPLVIFNGEPSSPSFGNPASVTDPLGHTTQLTYDGNGNLLTVTDPNGNVSSMTYNGAITYHLSLMCHSDETAALAPVFDEIIKTFRYWDLQRNVASSGFRNDRAQVLLPKNGTGFCLWVGWDQPGLIGPV